MSMNRLALFVAGALILLSAAGITYLSAERPGTTRLTAMQLDGVMHTGGSATDAAFESPTHGASHSLPGQVPPSQARRQAALSKAAATALIGGALGASSRAIVSSEAR